MTGIEGIDSNLDYHLDYIDIAYRLQNRDLRQRDRLLEIYNEAPWYRRLLHLGATARLRNSIDELTGNIAARQEMYGLNPDLTDL